ncbi:AI-2E family transporter [Silvimonas sp. JCM 19000]
MLKSRLVPPETALQLSNMTGAAAMLALLYFGREVLIPITLAIMLSLLIAPLVRANRRVGFGHTSSVVAAVLVLMLGVGVVGLVIGAQVVRMGSSLPQYEATVRDKLAALDQLTVGKLDSVAGPANRVFRWLSDEPSSAPSPSTSIVTPGNGRLQVEVHQPPARPIQILSRFASGIGGPLGTMGIVFVVLIFVLLEHEALRDRLISVIGRNDLRATTLAVNDAGERLSRFFLSQFAVNGGVGVLAGLGLALIGLPHAFLWGSMAAIMRFVPYVGLWIAALFATLLAAAISPTWTMAIMTVILFGAIEVVVSQLVEPKLYGHTTGLSPLAVVIAAIFWGWIWGPVGLVLSTPLTLCLVVAGRYIQPLHILEVLLGEVPALTLPENFYQRSLSGDSQEIIQGARSYVKRKSPAAYCDAVLLPALHLARMDFADRAITRTEQIKVGSAMSAVVQALTETPKFWHKVAGYSVIEGVNVGRQLREQRERESRKLAQRGQLLAGDKLILAVGLGSVVDEIATEILVRIMRMQNMDSRHLALDELDLAHELAPGQVGLLCFVTMQPELHRDKLEALMAHAARQWPDAELWAVFIPNPFESIPQPQTAPIGADQMLTTYESVVAKALVLTRKGDVTGLV